MARDIVDDFLDALRDSLLDTTREFTERLVAEQLPHTAPRPRVKPPKQAKAPKAAKVKREPQGPTLYDALECSPRASKETIEAAHKSLARRNHPDTNKSKQAEERMKILNHAKDILLDAAKRKAYDRSIGL